MHSNHIASFSGKKAFDEKKDVAKQKLRLLPTMSAQLQSLLPRILHPDVDSRATLDEIKSSDWLRSTPYAISSSSAIPTTNPSGTA